MHLPSRTGSIQMLPWKKVTAYNDGMHGPFVFRRAMRYDWCAPVVRKRISELKYFLCRSIFVLKISMAGSPGYVD